jgi:hypothetical protein
LLFRVQFVEVLQFTQQVCHADLMVQEVEREVGAVAADASEKLKFV